MAKNDYIPFDYFSTNMFYVNIDYSDVDNYGITQEEVELFLEVMEKDRKYWEKKRDSIDNWAWVLQLLVSGIFIPFVALMLSSYMGHNYDMDDFIPSTLFAMLLFVIIGLEVLIWTKCKISDFIEEWGKLHYRRKSQYKPKIEKFIEDSMWNQWQKHHSKELLS